MNTQIILVYILIQPLSASERMRNKSNYGEGRHQFSLEQLTTLKGNEHWVAKRGTCTNSQGQDQERERKQTLSRHITEIIEKAN